MPDLPIFFSSICRRYGASNASAADGSPCAMRVRAWRSGRYILLCNLSGGAYVALVQVDQRLASGNVWQTHSEILLACILFCLRQKAGRANQISPG